MVQSEESEEDGSGTLTSSASAAAASAASTPSSLEREESVEAGVNLFILAGHEAMQL